MNKRGVSGVIIVVLLVAIVLTAIAIVWVFVKAFLEASAEQAEAKMFYSPIDIMPDSVKLDRDSGIVKFAVKRGAGEGNLQGLRVLLIDENGKSAMAESFVEPPNELEQKVLFINYNEHVNELKEIEIAPVFKTKRGKEIVGEILSSYVLNGNEPLPEEAFEGLG